MSLINKLFGKRAKPGENPYLGLRNLALSFTPPADSSVIVHVVLFELGMAGGSATLVAVADGTVSMYYSGGGGILGLGSHEGPHRAAEALLDAAPKFLSHFRLVTEFPPPDEGGTRFYVKTNEGIFAAAAESKEFYEQRHPLTPLFARAQDLITQVRLNDEKRNNT